MLATIATLFPTSALVQEVPDPAVDPLAVEIAMRAANYLAEQPRISFNWFNTFDVVVEGREKITYTLSGTSYLSRNEGFFASIDYDGEYREYIYDGATFVVHHVEENAFSEIPFVGEFEELVERLDIEYGLTVPMWSLLSRDLNDAFLENVEAAAYLGETRFAGNPVHHLAFSEYEQDWQIWISTDIDRPVIYAFVGTEPHVQGWPQFRAHMADWDFETLPEEGAFSFEPPENAVRMILSRGGNESEAPVFETEEE
ncbi:DUF2092 domain-containing protein [Ruegeria pomeroyi]|nr:DUF2092 domain-containing protein [Ruegeria pomeroyi]